MAAALWIASGKLEAGVPTSRPMEPVPAKRSSQRESGGSAATLPLRDWIMENTAARTCT